MEATCITRRCTHACSVLSTSWGQLQYSSLLELDPDSDRIRGALSFVREDLSKPRDRKAALTPLPLLRMS